MIRDRGPKARQMGEHLPGFRGYDGTDHGAADLQLRRHLAGEIGRVRDRLADLIPGCRGPEELCRRLGLTLRALAFLREEVDPLPSEAAGGGRSPEAAERLLDFDLLLLEKTAGLHSLLDRLEWAAGAAEAAAVADLLDEGVAEVEELYRERRVLLLSRNEAEREEGA